VTSSRSATRRAAGRGGRSTRGGEGPDPPRRGSTPPGQGRALPAGRRPRRRRVRPLPAGGRSRRAVGRLLAARVERGRERARVLPGRADRDPAGSPNLPGATRPGRWRFAPPPRRDSTARPEVADRPWAQGTSARDEPGPSRAGRPGRRGRPRPEIEGVDPERAGSQTSRAAVERRPGGFVPSPRSEPTRIGRVPHLPRRGRGPTAEIRALPRRESETNRRDPGSLRRGSTPAVGARTP